ncbi:MAG: zf-HC2 domain-containing protein [Candidatus Sulfotelmatobacter sp.]
MTERYLLGELDPQACQEFEEHFFDCPDCALDVRTAALFIEHSKNSLAKESEPVAALSPVTKALPPKPGWSAWLRPAFAVPVMALLLAVIGYQNLVIYPRQQQAFARPQVLPSAFLNIGAMGSGDQPISIAPEQSFLLLVRIPPDSYPRHTAELYNPAGKLEWSLTLPSSSTQEQWPLQVPGAKRESGTYSLVVHGLTDNEQGKEVGRVTFDLQIQK